MKNEALSIEGLFDSLHLLSFPFSFSQSLTLNSRVGEGKLN